MPEHSKRIVAAMIAGGASLDGGHLQKCVESVSPHVDAVVIAFNGPGEWPLSDEVMEANKVFTRSYEWEDDFGLARNQSFELAKEYDPDWILWIDADDVLVDGDKLRPMVESLEDDVVAVFMRYDYLVDEEGKPLIQQWRERLMSTKTDWRWSWPIHEVCHSRPGEHYTKRDDVRVAHQKKADEDNSKATRARNRKLLMKALREFPDEPRFLYYIANETLAAAQNMEPSVEREQNLHLAIDYYKQFIAKTPWNDDAYLANCNMGEAYIWLGEYNTAMDVFLQSFKLYHDWPHAYMGIANCCLKLGDPGKAGWWAELCLAKCKPPDTTQVYEPRLLDFQPYLMLGLAHEANGEFVAALEDYNRALESDPDNEVVLEKVAELNEAAKQVHAGAQQYDDGGELWKQQRSLYFGTTPERSIAFLTKPLFEPWQPSLEAVQGAGGAETCIMRLAPRFVRDGWRVVVFGTPQAPGVEHDGVEYYPVNEWDPNERFHTVVSSRGPEFFDARINADVKLLWMHDVNVGPEFAEGDWGNRLDDMDAIIGLTSWHATHMRRLYDLPAQKMAVIPNGIELGRYDGWNEIEHRAPKFIYSSSPDRGLDVVLRMWPAIKDRIPDAELHVYYGWAAIDKIIGGSNAERRGWLGTFKTDIEIMLGALGREEAGIFWHDRVSQAELAEAQKQARYWLYPTYFCETFCITAIEAQAAGMIPLTSDLAALTETVICRDLRQPGYPNNDAYVREFLARLDRAEKIGDLGRAEYQNVGRAFAEQFSWDHVAQIWSKVIAHIAGAKVTA